VRRYQWAFPRYLIAGGTIGRREDRRHYNVIAACRVHSSVSYHTVFPVAAALRQQECEESQTLNCIQGVTGCIPQRAGSEFAVGDSGSQPSVGALPVQGVRAREARHHAAFLQRFKAHRACVAVIIVVSAACTACFAMLRGVDVCGDQSRCPDESRQVGRDVGPLNDPVRFYVAVGAAPLVRNK
jgi:hypothetical protein